MSKYTEETDDVVFSEPVLAQKGVKVKVGFVQKVQWESKKGGEKTGDKYDACKLTLTIEDSSVRTEHEDAKPRLTFEDQFNIERFPYTDKNTGEQKWLGRSKLYQLEQALGFDPVFTVDGNPVEPFITKNGNKVAPKVDSVKRSINPDFFDAYFTADGDPITDNWVDKVLYADLSLEKSEKFGDKNSVARYVKAPKD